MPSAGSVAADLTTSSLHLAVIIAMVAAGVAVLVWLLRVFTGQRQHDVAAQRRAREQADRPPRPPAAPATRFMEATPPGPGLAPPRRRPAAGHHPAGRRAPGTGQQRAVTPAVRRPLQLVAADLRRLTRELTTVPGGMPMARRRGLLAAYDDVLVEAADLLQVPHRLLDTPEGAREFERLRLLGELEAAGLVTG
ncbi:hypothetical protein [uncultured Modestobacter sp.]|uniref:hypothetical protein n=1 Tax=uncultured Modestobacter sp. TaxID=380048 RepID=UPI00260C8959|nr:hypothetical protein [uncultured Modestobacter sp.]